MTGLIWRWDITRKPGTLRDRIIVQHLAGKGMHNLARFRHRYHITIGCREELIFHRYGQGLTMIMSRFSPLGLEINCSTLVDCAFSKTIVRSPKRTILCQWEKVPDHRGGPLSSVMSQTVHDSFRTLICSGHNRQTIIKNVLLFFMAIQHQQSWFRRHF